MSWNRSLVAEVLRSLVPKSPEELRVMRDVVEYAESARHRSYAEVAQVIPQEALRDFHGLMEAMEVYQSIYGKSPVELEPSPGAEWMHALRQIRDMCLEEGLHSIY